MFGSAPSSLSVRFRGVRGSIPSPGIGTVRYGGNTSCVELRCGNEILILDAGTGIRSLGDDLLTEFGSESIHASVLISHTHWDHIQGFPFFAPLYYPQNRIRVFAGRGLGTRVDEALRNQMQSRHFPVHLDRMQGLSGIEELSPDATSLGPFTIRTIALNHPGGCAAFHITAGDASLVYAPDHEPHHSSTLRAMPDKAAHARTQALVEFIREIDLLILDSQYTAAEYPRRRGWGHGCLPDSVDLALRANVRHLVLFHHDPGHDDELVEQMVETGRGIAADSNLRIDAAREERTIVVETCKAAVQLRSLSHSSRQRARKPAPTLTPRPCASLAG